MNKLICTQSRTWCSNDKIGVRLCGMVEYMGWCCNVTGVGMEVMGWVLHTQSYANDRGRGVSDAGTLTSLSPGAMIWLNLCWGRVIHVYCKGAVVGGGGPNCVTRISCNYSSRYRPNIRHRSGSSATTLHVLWGEHKVSSSRCTTVFINESQAIELWLHIHCIFCHCLLSEYWIMVQ